MPGIGEDWINNPLGIIQHIIETNEKTCSINMVKEYFQNKIQTKNAVSWIPSLNDVPLHTLKPNSLVKFRCMIQDIYDPEFYLGLYQVEDLETSKTFQKSGMYKDIADCSKSQKIDLESKANVTMDRQTLYCVPIPGETAWVKETYADNAGTKVQASTSHVPIRNKRTLDEDSEDVAMETTEPSTPEIPDNNEPKRTRTDDIQGSSPQAGHDLNFPLQSETGTACLVKIYDDIDQFKVNDMVEFIGVLSVDPSLAQFNQENQLEEFGVGGYQPPIEEINAHAPPPSLVPRLHAVLSRKLYHNNPLLPQSPESEEYKGKFSQLQQEIECLRGRIMELLEHAMFGDSLAAEFFLLHILSSVYGRADVMPLGKFCLNLSQCPTSPKYGQLIQTFMAGLLTQSHLLPLSIDNMNTLRMGPEKDYTANRLKSGMLQLAERTSLVIDESALQPGQLEASGIKNMTALGNLISWQKVEYDFSYHRQDFMANIAVLVLSEAKSILPSDCLLPLKPQITPDDLLSHFNMLESGMTAELLTKIRTYITLAKHIDYSLQDDIQKIIQEDFVEIRKVDSKSMSVDDFHSLLNIVRLLSLSYLKNTPTQTLWRKAKNMDAERKRRISQQSTK